MSAASNNTPRDLAMQLPLTGRHLIEASAGTGKTYTIAGLYVRQIVEAGRQPSALLVMTFTRAATDELRSRLRRRLAACLDVALAINAGQGGPDAPDNDHAWAGAYLAQHSVDDALCARLRSALNTMDEAAIYTIHGFCQRLLTEFAPLLADVVPDATLVPSDADLITDYATDYWLRVAGDSDRAALDELPALGSDPAALAQHLGPLAAFAGVVQVSAPEPPALTPAAVRQAVATAEQALHAAWQRSGPADIDALRAGVESGAFNAQSFPAPATLRGLAALATALAAGHLPELGQVAKLCASALRAKRKKAFANFMVPALFDALEQWVGVRGKLATTLRATLALDAVDGLRTTLAARKLELARQSYDDLIRIVADAVAGPRRGRLVAALRQRFPVALLDEFQDTDARQFSIFDAIFAADPTAALYLVGDPKQAIYGFRGGDLATYLKVAAQAGTQRHHLDTNYRSSARLLIAVAALFAQAKAPFVDARIAFDNVQPGHAAADDVLRCGGQPVAPMTLWALPDTVTKADAQRQYFANASAATIADLLRRGTLDGEPIKPQQIAVLTNTNAEITRVQAALAKLGIASACVRHESVFATREARELLRLLDALLATQSSALARGALATRIVGVPLSDIRDEAAWHDHLDALAELRQCWLARGILAMVQRVAERHAAHLLALAEGERIVGNLLQLGETLQADARTLDGPHALRDELAARIQLADTSNEAEQLRLESDAERVQVATVHATKGLEYALVFLPFAGLMKVRPIMKGQILDYRDANGACVRHWLLNDAADRTAADKAALAAATAEAMGECLRKFYVAVTRAKYACWLALGEQGVVWPTLLEAADDKKAEESLADKIAALATCTAIDLTDDIVAPAPWQAPVPNAKHAARVFAGRIARDWQRWSFSRLTRGGHDLLAGTRDEPDDGTPEAPAGEVIDAPAGTRFGTAAHAILEHADFAAWRDCVETPATQRSLVERELRAQGYASGPDTGGDAVATGRLIAATLNAECLPGLRFAEVPPQARRAEMEFDFGMGGCDNDKLVAALQQHGYQLQRDSFSDGGARLRGLMNGIIDLIFRHDGRWYLVDWKTNRLGAHYSDYEPARLAVAVAAFDYDLQYLIYTVALHRWLRTALGAAWNYDRDFGGVRYLFLRGLGGGAGCGIYADKPPLALIEKLDDLLAVGVRA